MILWNKYTTAVPTIIVIISIGKYIIYILINTIGVMRSYKWTHRLVYVNLTFIVALRFMSGLIIWTLIGLTVSTPTLYFSSTHHGVVLMSGSQFTSGSNFGPWGILNGSNDTRAPVSGRRCVFSYGVNKHRKKISSR